MRHKTDILDVAARKLAPYMFVFGLYLVTYGDLSPGGGFQGGVVIASGIILLAIAKSVDAVEELIPLRRFAVAETTTFGLLLAVGIGGIVAGAGFLADFIGRGAIGPLPAARFVYALNILIGAKVAAGASLICMHLFGEER